MEIEELIPISKKKKLFLLIGDPIDHSLSPIMHNAAFKDLDLNYDYHRYSVKKRNLRRTVEKLKEINVSGFNVTAPHKQSIIKYLDEIDPVAKEIGAVNTVLNVKGRLVGYNTDWIGAKVALSKYGKIKDKKIVIIGAGGAARAIVYAAIKEKAKVKILNRDLIKAKKLANKMKVEFGSLDELNSIEADILVNSTPVGLHPNENLSIARKKQLKKFSIVFDIVYNPLSTKLLKLAKAENCMIISGLDMFIHQGVAAFKIWTKKNPNEKLMYKKVEKFLKK